MLIVSMTVKLTFLKHIIHTYKNKKGFILVGLLNVFFENKNFLWFTASNKKNKIFTFAVL